MKNSASSTSVPISHMGATISNSRLVLNTSNGNSSNVSISNYSAHDSTSHSNSNIIISPKSKHRSVSSSQPITANKYISSNSNNNMNGNNSSIALSSESSSVSTIKLSGNLCYNRMKTIIIFCFNFIFYFR